MFSFEKGPDLSVRKNNSGLPLEIWPPKRELLGKMK